MLETCANDSNIGRQTDCQSQNSVAGCTSPATSGFIGLCRFSRQQSVHHSDHPKTISRFLDCHLLIGFDPYTHRRLCVSTGLPPFRTSRSRIGQWRTGPSAWFRQWPVAKTKPNLDIRNGHIPNILQPGRPMLWRASLSPLPPYSFLRHPHCIQ